MTHSSSQNVELRNKLKIFRRLIVVKSELQKVEPDNPEGSELVALTVFYFGEPF